ncbi:MAG TPA: hypothetical protein VGE44_14525 [Daejeonella sp.]|uniref:beta strand repeat-containing protein n=1 Tax=Daejeonella sp. TaxID=2805397 RepID=UPI002EDB3975
MDNSLKTTLKTLFTAFLLLGLSYTSTAQTTSTLPSGYTPLSTQIYYKIDGGDTTFISGATGKGFHRLATTQSLRDSLYNFYTKTESDARFVPLTRTLNINGTTQDLSVNRTWSVGTVTSVGATAGTGISIGGTSPITSSGTYTITNTAPDQTILLNSGTGISTTGDYPSFTITNTLPDQTVVLTAGTGISTSGTYPNFTITNTSPSSGGTVTSITPGYGLTPQTAITSSGTFGIDSASIQTVANFFPKGDTRYAKIGDMPTISFGTFGSTPNAQGGSYSGGVITLEPADATNPGGVTTNSQTLAGLKSFNGNIELGTTGMAGRLSLKRSSDGVIASIVEQIDANKLTLTSAGGTKLFDINADRVDFNSGASTATYWFGQNRPSATEVLINGSNNNKLILQNNEVAQLTLNSNGGTITAASLGSSGDVIVGANNTGLAGKITVGFGLSLTAGVLTATGGASGTVTTAGGTAGKIAKFTSASNIENSIMTETGSVISIAGDVEISGANGFSAKSLAIGTDGTIANYRWQTSLSGNDEIFASRSFGIVRTTNYTTGATVYSGALSATNLSGTNTGDQTSVTGNAGTATALQTARNIQGVSFNGTADINPINGTGFVKATGTTLSYDNNTYLTGNQSITLSGAVTGTGTTAIATTLASGIDATKIADGTVTSAEFQYINSLTSNVQTQLDSKLTTAVTSIASGSGMGFSTITGTGTITMGTPSSITSSSTNSTSTTSHTHAITSLPSATTATTQTAGDNSTKVATTAYVDSKFTGYGGSFTYSGTSATTLTVTLGFTVSGNYAVTVTPSNTAATAQEYYVTNKTSTTFDIVMLSSNTDVTFEWVIAPSASL